MANPGSDAARRLGCRCPVIDNNYGEGAVIDGQVDFTQFYISPDCPIHADSRTVVSGVEGDRESIGAENEPGDSQLDDSASADT